MIRYKLKNKNLKKNIFRVLDVNLNRAREGMRVIEDTARFIWNDRSLYYDIRTLRHRLDRTARELYCSLIGFRNSDRDIGKRAQAKRFTSIKDIIQTNLRRVEESLRVLEEYSRFINIPLTPRFQKLRFNIYAIEKKVFKKYLNPGYQDIR